MEYINSLLETKLRTTCSFIRHCFNIKTRTILIKLFQTKSQLVLLQASNLHFLTYLPIIIIKSSNRITLSTTNNRSCKEVTLLKISSNNSITRSFIMLCLLQGSITKELLEDFLQNQNLLRTIKYSKINSNNK
jgi:hypothetical protein